MSLSDGESFLHLFYACVEPDTLLGHTTAPKSVPHVSRLPPVLLSSPLMRHQTPRIFAAPARTGEDALIVEAQSTAPVLSTSRPRSPSSPTRRVHPHPLSPSPRPLTCPAVRACVRLAACPAGAPFSTVLHAPRRPVLALAYSSPRAFLAVAIRLPLLFTLAVLPLSHQCPMLCSARTHSLHFPPRCPCFSAHPTPSQNFCLPFCPHIFGVPFPSYTIPWPLPSHTRALTPLASLLLCR